MTLPDDSLTTSALQQRLSDAARPPLPPQQPTSPVASRFSVSSGTSRFPGDIPPPQHEDDSVVKRKKSGLRLSLSLGSSKNGSGNNNGPNGSSAGGDPDAKLPKEFVLEFWGRVGAEDGDSGWQQGVRGLLLLVQKKGTKVGNVNMREIPALLQSE